MSGDKSDDPPKSHRAHKGYSFDRLHAISNRANYLTAGATTGEIKAMS